MALAALLYIHNVSATTTVGLWTDQDIEDGGAYVFADKYIPDYVSVVRICGPFLFGTTEKLEHSTTNLSRFGPVVVLKMTHMTAIDGTGVHALERLARSILGSGRTLICCGLQPQPKEIISRSKFAKLVGQANMQPHLEAALERAAIVQGGFDCPQFGVWPRAKAL
jgi:SulP family sulfate permease